MQRLYKDYRKLSDTYITKAIEIIGDNAKVADDALDIHESTDFITEDNTRFAWRMRKHKWLSCNDITIRYAIPDGSDTEFAKIMKGHGNYLLYTWLNENDTDFAKHVIIDLDLLRDYIKRGGYYDIKSNVSQDGGNKFAIFSLTAIRNCITTNWQFDNFLKS